MILGRPLSHNQANTFICSLSIIFTEAIKNALKFIFGRTWPETWVQNNPSFIRDGVYGFHFMHGGAAYQSFPSGHMAATCTVISVLWIRYPHFRRFYLIVGLFVGSALVGANYHFLSDVIAGAFLGASSGWMATVIWDACASRRMAIGHKKITAMAAMSYSGDVILKIHDNVNEWASLRSGCGVVFRTRAKGNECGFLPSMLAH